MPTYQNMSSTTRVWRIPNPEGTGPLVLAAGGTAELPEGTDLPFLAVVGSAGFDLGSATAAELRAHAAALDPPVTLASRKTADLRDELAAVLAERSIPPVAPDDAA